MGCSEKIAKGNECIRNIGFPPAVVITQKQMIWSKPCLGMSKVDALKG